MDEPVTPDNTRVFRIMTDFREFMKSTTASPEMGRSISQSTEGIPFRMLEDTQESSNKKRAHSSAFHRAELAQVESKHVCDERAHKLARLDLENRNQKLATENMQLNDKCDRLQLKVKEVTMQAIEAQDKLQELRRSRMSEKEKLEETVLELQKNKQSLESSLQHNIDDVENVNHELRQQNFSLTLQMNVLQEKLAEATSLLENKIERNSKLTADLKDHENCEKKLLDFKMKVHELESRLSRSSEAEEVMKVMKDDVQRLRDLEIEVVSLRESNLSYRENESNLELMKEKLLAAKSKLARCEKRLEETTLIELENKDLISQLDEAKSLELRSVENDNLTSKLRELQQKEAMYFVEKGEISSELRSYKKKCEVLQTSIDNWEQKCNEKNECLATKETQIRHLQKRALLLAGERNSLRAILQSYESEIVSTSHAEQLITRAKNAESANEKVHARLVEVQKEVQDNVEALMHYKLTVKQLESNISALKEELRNSGGSKSEKDVLIDNLHKKIEELERDRSDMQKQKENLELWVERNKMRGDFDPKQTKVIHFRMNPADLAHKQSKIEVAELKAKCLKLQEKIRKLEENQDVTMSDVTMNQEGAELKQKLVASELRNQRLKEVFSKKVQEFRQACYALTGYRIDLTTDGQFKLVPMYAENESDYLLFKLDPSQAMQLLETEYSRTLTSFIELHLHHQNSIPMFLSSVIADLFSQQTMM